MVTWHPSGFQTEVSPSDVVYFQAKDTLFVGFWLFWKLYIQRIVRPADRASTMEKQIIREVLKSSQDGDYLKMEITWSHETQFYSMN